MIHKKKPVLLLFLIAVLLISCFVFARQPLIWNSSQHENMQNISADDFNITFTDEQSVIIENNVHLNNMQYNWIVYNTIDGVDLTNNEILPDADNKIIEIYYQDIKSVSFIAVISYDDVLYYSDRFAIDENLNLTAIENIAFSTKNDAYNRDVNDIVSLAYLAFLLVSVVLYYVTKQKCRWVILLCANVAFYLLSDIYHIFILIFSSLIIFLSTLYISDVRLKFEEKLALTTNKKLKNSLKNAMRKHTRIYLFIALFSVLFVLIALRYSSFIEGNLNSAFGFNLNFINFVSPLGLSFYAFIVLGYLFDVYKGKYNAEKNYFKFLLFASFFAHISQGPISRFNELSPQFYKRHKFNYKNICFAAQRILWGFFIKLVLADRLNIFTAEIFANYANYSWLMLILATCAFSVQIYTDFYSSMEIAIGSAQMFGIKLSENFMRPYFSKNMPEFWRRWHITLGSWFKDYVFYPISISKTMLKFNVNARKKFGNYIASVLTAIAPVFGVWLLTGLWHGASWAFIAWGLYHGALIMLSIMFARPLQQLLEKLKIKTNTAFFKMLQMAKVFTLCSIGRVFFYTNSLKNSSEIFSIIFSSDNPNDILNFKAVSLNEIDFVVIVLSICALLFVSILQENKISVRAQIAKKNIVLRWAIYYALIIAILIFGMYGLGTMPNFIYEAF